jgi:hypothetical protein
MTCQEIYDITMALMDEMLDNGNVDYNSTKDYTARTPGILTILQTQVIMYFKSKGMDVDTLDRLMSMEDEVDLSDDICMGVLPYGLAARLLGQEDTQMSSYFSQLYNNALSDAAESSDDKAKGKQYSGENIYGLMEAGD